MLLTPSPLSQTVTPSRTHSPFERDVLYGRPHSFNGIVKYADYCLLEILATPHNPPQLVVGPQYLSA